MSIKERTPCPNIFHAIAVALNRKVMGATAPSLATPVTIRADFGTSIQRNAVHGSDTPTSTNQEIAQLFQPSQIHTKAN